MRKFALALVVAALAWGAARPALAILQFYKVWDEVYLAEHENKEFVEQVRNPRVRCLVCHQGKNRKHHNPYGIHLVEPLDKKRVAVRQHVAARHHVTHVHQRALSRISNSGGPSDRAQGRG